MIKIGNEINSKLLSRKVSLGKLKRIRQGIYLEPNDSAAKYIEIILKSLNIKGIISYRSALEFPDKIVNDEFFIIGEKNRKIVFDGDSLVIHIINKNELFDYPKKSYGPTQVDGLNILNKEVAILLQFHPSQIFQKRSNKELAGHHIVQQVLAKYGNIKYVELYFKILAKEAKEFDLMSAFANLVGWFESFYKKYYLSADEDRVSLFKALQDYLLSAALPHIVGVKEDSHSFYEAYFTNYIEGTEFEIEEAQKIIYNSNHRYERHKDGHDIKATYEIVKSLNNFPMNFENFSDFEKCLKDTHYKLMKHRSQEIAVGEYKRKINRAGNLVFVYPEQVRKTLEKGFLFYQQLQDPFAKAIYMMAMLAEVHPFEDGNGRIARIFMNNELTKNGLLRIIIPTVFRDDYIASLKGFSYQKNVSAITNTLIKAQKITNQINWSEKLDVITDFIRKNSGFEKDNQSAWGVAPNEDVGAKNKDNEDENLPFSLSSFSEEIDKIISKENNKQKINASC